MIKKSKRMVSLFGFIIGIILTNGCSELEIAPDAELELNSQSEVPTVGKTYYIKNRKSGKHLSVANASNSNGANVEQRGDDSGTHRQWEILSVGNGYVRIKGVDSGKSIEVAGGNNSNGTNIEMRAYGGQTHQQWEIKSTSSGYYRMKSRDSGKSIGVTGGSTSDGANIESRSWNGNNKFQWLFTEVGTSNPPTGNSPAAVMGIDEDDWKLNVFSGSVNDPNYLDAAPDLDNYSNSNWFYTDGSYSYFKCWSSYPGNDGDDENPRVELRELNGSGSNASWNGTTNTLHRMVWSVKIDRLPSSGKLCYGQIHADNNLTDSRGIKYDDMIRVQVEGNANQTSGSVSIKINGWVTEDNGDESSDNVGSYTLGTTMNLELTMQNGVIQLKRNGSTIYTYNGSGSNSVSANSTGNYFKAGNYLQSVKQINTYNSNDYGVVGISNLDIYH